MQLIFALSCHARYDGGSVLRAAFFSPVCLLLANERPRKALFRSRGLRIEYKFWDKTNTEFVFKKFRPERSALVFMNGLIRNSFYPARCFRLEHGVVSTCFICFAQHSLPGGVGAPPTPTPFLESARKH